MSRLRCYEDIFHKGIFVVLNRNNDELGKIFWYPEWKCFVWKQERGVRMSESCLQEVIGFISNKEFVRNEMADWDERAEKLRKAKKK